MAYHKRSMKHRKSSRRHLKARRTRARRGGFKCFMCGEENVTVPAPGRKCLSCSSKVNGYSYTTRQF